MSKKIQYQQNIDIINKFFKKPITLITGILSILSAFTFSVAVYYGNQPANNIINDAVKQFDFLTGNQRIQLVPSVLINIFPILFGISLVILHFFSEDNGNKTHSVSKFFKITSLINAIISIIVAVGVLCISIATVLIFNNIITILICFSLLLVSVFFIIMNFSRVKFAKAINSSVNSIYLNKKGSALFGVLNFICGFFSLILLLFVISTHYFAGIHLFALLPFIVYLVLLTAEKIFWGITCIKYSMYVQGVVYGKVKIIEAPTISDFERQVTEEFLSEEISATKPDVNLNTKDPLAFTNPPEKESPIADFVFPQQKERTSKMKSAPATVVVPKSPAPATEDTKKESPDESIDIELSLKKLQMKKETASLFSCPDCGSPFTEEDFFCSVCGRKLI